MEILFWTSACLVAYVYAGYPVLLAAWAWLAPRPPRKGSFPDGAWPAISIVVAARNEAPRLRGRIDNLLSLEYDGTREVIVVSDGSTDATADALGGLPSAVRLIEIPASGKASALNAGVAAAAGDIVIFADARQRFDAGALRALVSNFADPAVGGVTGELILDCESGRADSTIGDGVGVYWKYEKWLRRKESLVRSTLGATGAIYALRRMLWRPLPEETLLDDVLAPMRAVLDGWRIVFEEDAVAFDRATTDAAAEARRKRRTLAGNYQILAQEPRLLIPIVNPVWLQYVSHKVGRLLVPWALLGALVASAALAFSAWIYLLAFLAQATLYGLAAVGASLERHDTLSRAARAQTVDASAVTGRGHGSGARAGAFRRLTAARPGRNGRQLLRRES
jgi:cellulose synthase/poly-beta-1,6-N-acetylglucosamine synthase-like glycosyltransferase